jgi:hypothetical protein
MRNPRWGSTKQALLAWTRNKVERAEGRGYRGGNARAEQSPRHERSVFALIDSQTHLMTWLVGTHKAELVREVCLSNPL